MIKPLRPREIEILEWIGEGKSNNEIAQILELSPHTIKNHLHKIIKKLGVSTRGQAVMRAISLGIVKHSRR